MISEATARKLARLGELASTPERRISPMPIAAQLLEDAVAQRPVGPAEGLDRGARDRGEADGAVGLVAEAQRGRLPVPPPPSMPTDSLTAPAGLEPASSP